MATYLTLKELGQYARKLREAREMSQEEVAELLGVSQGQISAVENITRDFSTERARKILVVLGGTTIVREQITFPVVEASDEEKAKVLSKNRNRRENDRLPPVNPDNLDLETDLETGA